MLLGQTSLADDEPSLSTFDRTEFRVLLFAGGISVLAWLIFRLAKGGWKPVPDFAYAQYTNEKGNEVYIIGREQNDYRLRGYFGKTGVAAVQVFFVLGIVTLALGLIIGALTRLEASILGFLCLIWSSSAGYSLGQILSIGLNKRPRE
jgi:hypothetical protein